MPNYGDPKKGTVSSSSQPTGGESCREPEPALHECGSRLQGITDNTAIPVGLVLNELISNALRYAFPPDGSGEIMVTARDDTRSLKITVHDNGKGFPENIDQETTRKFGLRIAGILADQVGGTISYVNDNGATATLIIPRPAENKGKAGP
jgi:two-component sensor histidine kinase